MKLREAPFLMIESGQKTIELRLYDEKRRQISVGDEIEFSCTTDLSQRIHCKVIALHTFDSFECLYKSLPLLKCGYTEKDLPLANPTDMEQYYSKQEQSLFGVVGIELELL